MLALPPLEETALLAQRLQAGDTSAETEFYERYERRVAAIIINTIGRGADLPDLVNLVFERALTDVRRLNDHRKLVPWLTMVTVNACRNHLRARRRRRWLQFFASAELPEVEAEAPSALERPVCLAAMRVLDRLEVEERLALALHYMQGLSQPEAAEAMELSLATFKRRLAVAATRFRELARRDRTLLEWLEVADAP